MARERSERPWIIGHRGAPGVAHEHTRQGYTIALNAGVDMIEPDLVPTKDGRLLCRHENGLGSTTNIALMPAFASRRKANEIDGKRLNDWFSEDFNWHELNALSTRERSASVRQHLAAESHSLIDLGATIEMVAEFNRATGRQVSLCLEFKHATYFESIGLDYAELLRNCLSQAGPDAKRVPIWCESDDPDLLKRLAPIFPGRIIQLVDNKHVRWDHRRGGPGGLFDDMVTDRGLDEVATYADSVAIGKPRLDIFNTSVPQEQRVTAMASRRGLQVFAWTMRSENHYLPEPFRLPGPPESYGDAAREYAAYFDEGVQAVFTDHPDHAIQARDLWIGARLKPSQSRHAGVRAK